MSATPDRSRIIVAVGARYPIASHPYDDIYYIDGATLQIQARRSPKPLGEFSAGYSGEFVHSRRAAWRWTGDVDEHNICEPCSSVDVLSPTDIVTTTGNNLRIMQGQDPIWETSFHGIRDGFSVSATGRGFVILSATRNGPFWPSLFLHTAVYDVLEARKSP